MGRKVGLIREVSHVMKSHESSKQGDRDDERDAPLPVVIDRLMKFRLAACIEKLIQITRHMIQNMGVFAGVARLAKPLMKAGR